jgi:hypothetical protein
MSFSSFKDAIGSAAVDAAEKVANKVLDTIGFKMTASVIIAKRHIAEFDFHITQELSFKVRIRLRGKVTFN